MIAGQDEALNFLCTNLAVRAVGHVVNAFLIRCC